MSWINIDFLKSFNNRGDDLNYNLFSSWCKWDASTLLRVNGRLWSHSWRTWFRATSTSKWQLGKPCTALLLQLCLGSFYGVVWLVSLFSTGQWELEPQWLSYYAGTPPERETCLSTTTESPGCLGIQERLINTHFKHTQRTTSTQDLPTNRVKKRPTACRLEGYEDFLPTWFY